MSNNFSTFSNTMNPHIQQVKYDYDPVVIKPPNRNVTHGTITKQIVIDSRDRDYLKYPDSNRYRVEITEEFRDVTSLELILAQIPNTFYNIAQENNKFYISANNFVPEVGDMFIFPASLHHYVNSFKSNGERISISGNLEITK